MARVATTKHEGAVSLASHEPVIAGLRQVVFAEMGVRRPKGSAIGQRIGVSGSRNS